MWLAASANCNRRATSSGEGDINVSVMGIKNARCANGHFAYSYNWLNSQLFCAVNQLHFAVQLAQLVQGGVLQLSDSLTAVAHHLTDLRHAVTLAVLEAVAQADDRGFARWQRPEQKGNR